MLADYFSRSALAAAQVISGFEEKAFRERLTSTVVGISLGPECPGNSHLVDLLVRLLARLYPRLAIIGPSVKDYTELALRINPKIELVEQAAVGVTVGAGPPFDLGLFVGSRGWHALLSSSEPQPITDDGNPFGAGAAACFAAAWLFRNVMLPDWAEPPTSLQFSTYSLDRDGDDGPRPPWDIPRTALIGAGAIGNGAMWALGAADLRGELHIVDGEAVDLSNLQRYVLTERADEGAVKVQLFQDSSSSLNVLRHHQELAHFLADHGYEWPSMLLALDSAEDRIAAQASLPLWTANAWTQPGDLGVSTHPRFGGVGACVACLYSVDESAKNEDELVAATLGVPELQMQVRTLLYTSAGVDQPLLDAVAQSLGLPLERLAPYVGRPIRDLYVQGFCGGDVIPMGRAGALEEGAREMHVPLPHQSALAGVLLASAGVAKAYDGGHDAGTMVTRHDVLKPVGRFLRQPLLAKRDGRCLCDDPDFVGAYQRKYALP